MADENRIHIEITGDPSGAVAATGAVEKATERLSEGTRSALGGLQQYYDAFKKNWLEVTAGIYAAWKALQKMWDFMQQAAELSEAMATLDALTRQYGITANDLVSKIGLASQGLIGMGSAARVAGDALVKGLRPEQLTQMASWAVTLSDIKGGAISTAEAFQMLSESIATGRERGLKALVGIVDLETKYGDLASRMTQAEKAQAMYAIAAERMGAIQQTVGEQTLSSADRLERFTNSVAKAKYYLGELLLVVGLPLIGAFQVAMTIIYGLAGAFSVLVQTASMATDALGVTDGATERWGRRAEEMYSNAAASAAEGTDNILSFLKHSRDLAQGLPALNAGLGGTSAEVQKLNRQIDDLIAKNTQGDLEQIRRQAAEYERQGADRVKVAAWVASEMEKIEREVVANAREAAERRTESDIQASLKVLELKKKTGEASEIDALRAQYEAQDRILAAQREKLAGDLVGEKNTARQADLRNRIAAIDRQINQLAEERVTALQTQEIANTRELARVKMDESIRSKEAENAILESMDAQAVRTGLVTHAEATRAKYDREREFLTLRMAQELSFSQQQGITAAEKLKHEEEYSRIERQLFDTRRRETDDLNNTLIEQETILLNLARQRADAERQHAQERLAALTAGLSNLAGAAGEGFSGLAAGIGDLGALAAGADPYTEQLAQLDSYHQQKLERIRLQAQAELEAKAAVGASEDELFAARQQWQAEMIDAYRQWDADSAEVTEQRKLTIASTAMGTMASLAQSFYALSGNQSKAAFAAYKAFSIAQTIIDTYKGAQGAFAALAGIPIVGPALGAAAAAAAILSGMMRVKQIQAMQPGGASVSASAGGAGVPAIPPGGTTSAPSGTEGTDQSKPTQTVNVHIYGNVVDHDKFARELVPAISKAIGDGVA